MYTEAEVRQLLAGFIGIDKPTLLAKVTEVNKGDCTCTLEDDGTEYLSVRLRPVTGENNGIVLHPKIGALALAVKVESTEDWMILFATACNRPHSESWKCRKHTDRIYRPLYAVFGCSSN